MIVRTVDQFDAWMKRRATVRSGDADATDIAAVFRAVHQTSLIRRIAARASGISRGGSVLLIFDVVVGPVPSLLAAAAAANALT